MRSRSRRRRRRSRRRRRRRGGGGGGGARMPKNQNEEPFSHSTVSFCYVAIYLSHSTKLYVRYASAKHCNVVDPRLNKNKDFFEARQKQEQKDLSRKNGKATSEQSEQKLVVCYSLFFVFFHSMQSRVYRTQNCAVNISQNCLFLIRSTTMNII